MTGLALRNAAARGDLEYERLGGRIVTTLRWIREWRERNRHQRYTNSREAGSSASTDEHRAARISALGQRKAHPARRTRLHRPPSQARLRALQSRKKAGRTRRPKG